MFRFLRHFMLCHARRRTHTAFASGMTVFLFLILMFICCNYALPQDNQQAIKVTADSSLVNYKLGVITYQGNVVIEQGTTHLAVDKVITKNNNKHKINEAIAYGINKQVDYTSIPKPGDKLLHAMANIIKFYPIKNTVILEGKVVVTQGKNSFQGERIVYNTKTQVVTIPDTQGGRATLIIEPDELKL